MAKDKLSFEEFLGWVNPANKETVLQLHQFFMQNGCVAHVEQAKSGPVVSYLHTASTRTVLNYVFRKKGMLARIYGDHVNAYLDFMETLPKDMQNAIDKAPACKRLLDPTKCNAHCLMGYDFTMNGKRQQNCRYNSFQFDFTEENIPYITAFIQKEVQQRVA